MKNQILQKIKDAKIVGRGGAAFPAALKWEFVKKEKSPVKYVICNASEGEIGIFKDFHILKSYPEKVFHGLKLAMDYLGTKEAFFNFNENYYNKLKTKIDKLVKEYKQKGYKIKIYKEHPSYPGGEETALINAMEGKRLQPRLKPPYPVSVGFFGKPTLIHNVETLMDISDVANGIYENKRFYSLSGPIKNPGVFQLKRDLTALQVLKETNNIPSFDYFVQIGGSASGRVVNKTQAAKEIVDGAGSIEVYKASINPRLLMKKWLAFYDDQSCGKCTPCREGTFQLHELLKHNKNIPWKKMMIILEVLDQTSFCALGKSEPIPIRSYLKNVLKKKI